MGSEWAEEQAGPQGPPGPQAAGSYLTSLIASAALTRYSGIAEDLVTDARVSAPLLGGHRYRISVHAPVSANAAGTVALLRIRYGSLTGPAVAVHRLFLGVDSVWFGAEFYGVHDAVTDAPLGGVYLLTCERAAGTGTVYVGTPPGEPITMEIQNLDAASLASA